MKRLWRQFWCKHVPTKWLTVSGYGYTEYQICFCERCEKLIWRQTKEQQ